MFPFSARVWCFLKNLTEKRNVEGWFLDICLCVLLLLLEKIQKEGEILFLWFFQRASRTLRPDYLGFSQRVRELCIERSWSLQERRGNLKLEKWGMEKSMERGSSAPGGRKGVPPAIGETHTPCLQSASRGRWSSAGAAWGQWRKVPNAKRCVLGTAKDLGVLPGGMESLALK